MMMMIIIMSDDDDDDDDESMNALHRLARSCLHSFIFYTNSLKILRDFMTSFLSIL